ncbi:MAG: alpha/beta fold hydrolase [bacterium]|nr:alpha/beta fold hydrolase [bacterium]
MEEKIFINNRRGQKISVLIEKSENQRGLVFVMHGLGGFKEQPHILLYAKAFFENDYTVVRFDTTNSIGESGGAYEDATATNYYEDLEDVIEWTESQSWYQEPFCLASHSLGGMCIALYAERYPEKVKALAPTSTVVSGKLSMDTHAYRDDVREWKKTGWLVQPSTSKPGVIKRLKWSHMEDRLKYDLVPNVHTLTMPVLLIVGEEDLSTPPEHQRLLYENLPGRKELHIIAGARHTFREKRHLEEVSKIFNQWIKSL